MNNDPEWLRKMAAKEAECESVAVGDSTTVECAWCHGTMLRDPERITLLETQVAALREALITAQNQIEYMHEKFQATGSGNQVLAQIQAALASSAVNEKQG